MITTEFPKVAFMPRFDDFGETFPLIEIAKKYMKLGGQIIFIGHKGEYESFAKDVGFKVIELKKNIPIKIAERKRKLLHNYHYKDMHQERFYSSIFNKAYEKLLSDKIEQEINILKKEKVKLAVAAYNFTSLISTRFVNIPLVVLIPGVMSPLYFKSKYANFPANYENFITRLFPQYLKNYLTNWYLLRCKWNVKGFNRLARRYQTPQINRFLDLFCGDYTFILDDIDFLNFQTTPISLKENFIGPILPKDSFNFQRTIIDSDVTTHLKRPGRSILLTFGSFCPKKIFLKVINALNNTNYNIIVVYARTLNEDEIPPTNDIILFKKFIPYIKKINEIVDLVIISGGRGTVYTAALSGKPIIGISMQAEQQWNLDNLLRYNVGIMLHNKYFNEKLFLNAINTIFADYENYLNNARLLKSKLIIPPSSEIAAKRILEIAITYNKTSQPSAK